jgi:hypothetical protein
MNLKFNTSKENEQWHKWFAWRPVKLRTNQWAWMKFVDRQYATCYTGCAGYTKYRPYSYYWKDAGNIDNRESIAGTKEPEAVVEMTNRRGAIMAQKARKKE